MKTAYFTFGQSHIHSIGGVTFDRNCVVKIVSEDPRQTMFDTFGPKWCIQHDDVPPNMKFYPRGILNLLSNPQPHTT